MVRDHLIYESADALLLRAAARPIDPAGLPWPDPDDTSGLLAWLVKTWEDPVLAEAVASASPSLALRVNRIAGGADVPARQVLSAAVALARYRLRAAGRPTPFGLFGGVAAARFGDHAQTRFGKAHQASACCDAAWLLSVIERCEACEPLAARLTVVFSTLAVQHAGRWAVPSGPDRQTVRDTPAVRAVRDAARSPVTAGALADLLGTRFPGSGGKAASMITELIRLGFLITSLRPPMTVTDSLGHVTRVLRAAGAREIPELASLLDRLETLHRDFAAHNEAEPEQQAAMRESLSATVTDISPEGRTSLCLDLRLDAEVTVPELVGREMAAAADALIRLTPNPAGSPVWEGYYRQFTERWGTGTAVPLPDVINPGTGLGFPASYPGSILSAPQEQSPKRHEVLARLITGENEIVLTDEAVDELTGTLFDSRYVPAHVEIAARIRAASLADLDAGRFLLHVSPARAVGTLTSRFSGLADGSGLEQVYRSVPVIHEGACAVQLSVPPLFIRGENVSRIPAYLPEILSLGEHRTGGRETLKLEDLALTATLRGLHLIHAGTGQVIEPQAFHPLDLVKQMPPLARFLAHIARAYTADYLVFDWGNYRQLPHLPAVRYRRSVLSPEHWRLTAGNLPDPRTSLSEWRRAMDGWRERTGCPDAVQLHNGDQTLRLDLGEPLHALALREHVDDGKPAVLTRAPEPRDYGWIGGHAHEIALPLVRAGSPAPAQMTARLVSATGTGHGQFPLSVGASWLSAKLFTSPDMMDYIIGRHLPALIESLGTGDVWFIRYRNREETDHLRVRVAAEGGQARDRAAILASWAENLRAARLCGRFALDTYCPETGRYGGNECMRAAETVFAADSAAAIAQLQSPPGADPVALTALSMLDITVAFLGGMEEGTRWLVGRKLQPAQTAARAVARTATTLARSGEMSSFGTLPEALAEPWRRRAESVAAYRTALDDALGAETDHTHIIESLLHIHHNRYRGIDRDREWACRHLARQAALAWRAGTGKTR